MLTAESGKALTRLFGELVNGVNQSGFVLNTGDVGLLRSLEQLSAEQASHSVNGGATIAAHTQHVRFGLSLMNQWAAEGGDPFTNARWDEAWKISTVDDAEWNGIRSGLKRETDNWLVVLGTPRDASPIEFTGLVSSIVHLAYHLGAIRQIDKSTRGPREGSFKS